MQLSLSPVALLGTAFGASEIGLALWKRSHVSSQPADAGSLRVLWGAILISWVVAIASADLFPFARFGPGVTLFDAPYLLLALGLGLRWYSILYLGKFFTVDVAIASEHRVIDTGPYRYIRHPSYSGALLAFLGFGLLFHNGVSLVMLVVPVTLAFLHRVRIEERALRSALGAAYVDYSARTKMLVPLLF
jgi:protein-S-isoprenylcysteine O-methyltransferase